MAFHDKQRFQETKDYGDHVKVHRELEPVQAPHDGHLGSKVSMYFIER